MIAVQSQRMAGIQYAYCLQYYTRILYIIISHTDYGGMMTRSQFLYSLNPYPIPNRKTCKMYENHRFLQKKWLSNAKSRTRNSGYTVTKFEQIVLPKIP